jgi:superfamily II DNA or RNA helicase
MPYLSKKGFVLKKNSITNEELTNLKLELQGKPLVDSKFNFKQENPSYPVYIETKNKIYIPKMYGIEKFGFPDTVLENYIGKEWETETQFNGTLLERQIEPVNALIKACKEKGGGILDLQTGFGKTVCMLYVLSKLKGKAIIVVNKIPLMNQWKSEISKFLPGIKVGTLQGQKNVDIVDCDIIVAMLQSMARIDYPDELFKDINVCVIDETHNLASKVFSQILFKLCCKYTIGLSATPKRADGCEYVFKWHLGNIVYKSNEKREGKPPIIRLLKIDTNDYKEVSTENKFTGQKQIQFTSMLSELIMMSKRNLLILELIKDLIKKEQGRKILVLSDRRNHLQNLKEILDNDLDITFTYGLFLGSMKQAALTQTRNSQLILATYAAFSEGVSVTELNTLILVSPKKYIGHLENKMIKNESGKLNQIVGRIFRRDHIEINPIIVDLQDNFSVYKSQGKSRVIFYKQHFTNGIFEEQSINLDDHVEVSVTFIKTKKRTEQIEKKIEELENNILNKCCIIDD